MTMIKIDTLKILENNPRKIDDAALSKLAESIHRDPEYMIARPLIVGVDNVILGGNQRLKAIRSLGMTDIPEEWIRRVEWDADKARRFVLVDNHLAGEWDVELLHEHWLDVGLEELGIEVEVVVPLDDMPALPDGDKEPFQQMTFTLHDEQAEQVKAAIEVAKGMGAFDSPNENSNGNALARVCETFLTHHA